MTMHGVNGGEAVCEALLANDVDTLFGLPGAQTYDLFDAFGRAEGLRVITPRHEQATAYMAFGYARASGRPGVYSVVPGPGVLNTGAALCSAQGASTPVLCVAGQVPAAFIGSGKGSLHELPDQLATLRSLTKWAARIDHPTEAGAKVTEAFRQMLGGRPGATALEIPWDVCGQQAACAAPTRAVAPPPPPVDGERITEAVALLEQAVQPMILVGSGAQHAAAEVRALAERLQAPVVSFRGGRGIVGSDHPLGFNCFEGYRRWATTDVVIAIGTRMELAWGRWSGQPEGLQVIRIDIDPAEMVRHPPAVGLVADARDGAAALAAACADAGLDAVDRGAEFAELKAACRAEVTARLQPQAAYLAAIRDVLPHDGILVEEISQVGFASYVAFPVHQPRTFISCGYQGTLGFGFNTALGVKVACPDRAVVSINGDGGFQFGLQELATAAQYRIGVVAVVFDNGGFGNVRRDQHRFYAGRAVGSEFTNPDFLKLAEAYGVAGYRAASPEALRSVLERALADDAPALVVVPVERGSDASPWPFLMPGTPYGAE